MTSNETAFELLQKFADELSGGDLQLPSLPRAVARLQEELTKPDFDVPKLATLAVTEPALAGSILNMANSAALRCSGTETLDLKVAIARIGADKVRALAMRFAMRQLNNQVTDPRSRRLLEHEWARSSSVATLCHLVAERSRAANPDEALVVGLVHNVGRIYLYSRVDRYPALFESSAALEGLVGSWHASAACAIIESWGLPAEAAEAVAQQEVPDDGQRFGQMTNVLRQSLALWHLGRSFSVDAVEALAADRSSRLLGLDAEALTIIVNSLANARRTLGLPD